MIPTLSSLKFQELAEEIGAKVDIEPAWKMVGTVTFKNGKKKYWSGSIFDINPHGAAEISKDKDFTCYFLKNAGFRVPEGDAFYSDEWALAIHSHKTKDKAVEYSDRIGYPIILKPNNGRGGTEVYEARRRDEVLPAIHNIFKKSKIARVEKRINGSDYRILTLGGELLLAYERKPLSVEGDGKRNVITLVREKNRLLEKSGRNTTIKENIPRIKIFLMTRGYQPKYIPQKGEVIVVLPNANLSSGGEMRDVTNIIHPSYVELARRASKAMNLPYCGTDIMTSASISEPMQTEPVIIEMNGHQPGFSQYAGSGDEYMERAVSAYRKLLRYMEEN